MPKVHHRSCLHRPPVGYWVIEPSYYPMGWSIAMANKEQHSRQYSVEEEQACAQEAQRRGMTVDDLKREQQNERETITNQGTDKTNN